MSTHFGKGRINFVESVKMMEKQGVFVVVFAGKVLPKIGKYPHFRRETGSNGKIGTIASGLTV